MHKDRFYSKFAVDFYQELDLETGLVKDIRYDIVAA
jgi:hypothetical protein